MAAFARRSPRARLYSLVPRSSQWPSIRTRLSFDFSQAALVSSIFASGGRMSYLSKSKNTSLRLSVARNSLGAGGEVGLAVDGATGDGVIDGDGVVEGAAAEGVGEPVGAGAEAAVVAGRLGQPTRKRERAITGTASSSALPRRCAISPILLEFVEFVISPRVCVTEASYHGRRGDQAALVDSPGVRGIACCSDPSASMVNSWYPPDRLDWKTRCRPLGAQDAPSLLPGPAVRRRRLEPSGLTAHRSKFPCREVNTIVSPLGDQRGWVLKPAWVRRRTLAPSASITNTWAPPARSDTNAISRPVGDQVGSVSMPL